MSDVERPHRSAAYSYAPRTGFQTPASSTESTRSKSSRTPAVESSLSATCADPLLSVTRRRPDPLNARTAGSTSGCTGRSKNPDMMCPIAPSTSRCEGSAPSRLRRFSSASTAKVSWLPAAATANPSRSTDANHSLAKCSGAPASAKRRAIDDKSDSVSLTSNTTAAGVTLMNRSYPEASTTKRAGPSSGQSPLAGQPLSGHGLLRSPDVRVARDRRAVDRTVHACVHPLGGAGLPVVLQPVADGQPG